MLPGARQVPIKEITSEERTSYILTRARARALLRRVTLTLDNLQSYQRVEC